MGLSIPSIGSGLGNLIGVGGTKPATAPAAPAAPATPPASTGPVSSKPVDSFDAGKPANCGGNTTEGVQCFPEWGKTGSGGGGGAGVNPTRGGSK
jgi:hypothetical protein